MKFILRIYSLFLIFLNMPVIFAEYFDGRTGREYGVGLLAKIALILNMMRNNLRIVTASNFLEHISMAAKVLNIPRSLEGCIVECGSYNGGSTANLSLVSALCNRRLEVFDSFEGLPEPTERDKKHMILNLRQVHSCSKKDWIGSLESVKKNVSRYGNANVCNFNAGYFNDTLPDFKQKCVFIFMDTDLVESSETCCRHLWPLLQDGCFLFTHEAQHMEIAALFFDREWWHKNLDCPAPGLIGAGSGLGLIPRIGAFTSAIGYTVKNPKIQNFETCIKSDFEFFIPK